MHRMIVAGSPRSDGRTASLANALFEACMEECPGDGVSIVSASSVEVAPCTGCDGCRAAAGEEPELPEEDPLFPCGAVRESDAGSHRCVIDDEMAEVRKHLDAADELVVVSPVYFAGPPAQLKALLDRLQPYYWSDIREGQPRPATLHVVGEGGDPHGFEPLVGIVRSALGAAGFRLERVLDWVGRISAEGDVLEEAVEVALAPLGASAGAALEGPCELQGQSAAVRERPRLDLGAPEEPSPAAPKGKGCRKPPRAASGAGSRSHGAAKGAKGKRRA